MGSDPGFLLHVQEGLCVGVTGIRQDGDEQVCIQQFACVCVHDMHCMSGPVHLYGFTVLVLQVHGGFGLMYEVGVVLVELCGLILQLTVGIALLAVFYPQQPLGTTALLYLPLDVLVVRHLYCWPMEVARYSFLATSASPKAPMSSQAIPFSFDRLTVEITVLRA